MDPVLLAGLIVNGGIFIASAGAAAVAWWQAIEASKSRDAALAAQQSALLAWQEAASALVRANEITGGTLRAPFASRLQQMSNDVLSQRSLGADESAVFDIIGPKHTPGLSALQLATNERTAGKFSRWLSTYARTVDASSPSAVMSALSIIDARVRGWIGDPDATMAEIRDEPGVPNELPILDTDLHDYRVP
ncbi:hypothetical protein [Microbacterium istanbulense]|uniref:Secreted protein n=1 Tax=Microbacterium istanbulense TaxID=3122049 RepID=A0ABU8LNM9_9MICO